MCAMLPHALMHQRCNAAADDHKTSQAAMSQGQAAVSFVANLQAARRSLAFEVQREL